MKNKKTLRHMVGLLDDFAFLAKVTGDAPRAKSLKKVARKLRKVKAKRNGNH
jgi:hypothetical protein